MANVEQTSGLFSEQVVEQTSGLLPEQVRDLFYARDVERTFWAFKK